MTTQIHNSAELILLNLNEEIKNGTFKENDPEIHS